MRRLLILPVALLGLVTSGAMASNRESVRTTAGKITVLSPTTITLGRNHRRNCSITPTSPATAAFAVGDRVKITCNTGNLVAISALPAPSPGPKDGHSEPSKISGAVSALTSASITVRDGDRSLTCQATDASPALAGVTVGSHIGIGCVDGKLTLVGLPNDARTQTTTTPGNTIVRAEGRVTALSATSIAVRGDGPTVTCTISPSSPSTTALKVGVEVTIGCTNGVLTALRAEQDDHGSTTTTTEQRNAYAIGLITAVGPSISVRGDGPTLTCQITSASPSLAGFAVGNRVKIYCSNEVLVGIFHSDPPPTTTTTATTTTTTTTSEPQTSYAIGLITAIGSSISVRGDGPTLTCQVATTSPSVASFAAGNRVKIYCSNGLLIGIFHNELPTTTTTTAPTTTVATTTSGTSGEPGGSFVGAFGTISALSATSLTVHGPERDLTCTVGTGSPSTTGFTVGATAKVYCQNGQLAGLAHV